jgi:hypothetical protein
VWLVSRIATLFGEKFAPNRNVPTDLVGLFQRQIELPQEIDHPRPPSELICRLRREHDLIEHLIPSDRRWKILDRKSPPALPKCD